MTLELRQDFFYHIYNRGNNGERIFYEERNYMYFLDKLEQYLEEYIELFAYSLLPNHFHLLVRIVRENLTITKQDKVQIKTVSKAFSNFFNCYTKSINIQEKRYGNLFQRPFKRKVINKEGYLETTVCYIHRNPVHHNLVKKIEDYKWSSYRGILTGNSNFLKCNEALQLFGEREGFVDFHNQSVKIMKEINLEF